MALKYVMIATDKDNEVVSEQEFPNTNDGALAWGQAVKLYWQQNYAVEIRLEDR